jgi:hypothetical protein
VSHKFGICDPFECPFACAVVSKHEAPTKSKDALVRRKDHSNGS